MSKTYECPRCGLEHQGEEPPFSCMVCKLPGDQFKVTKED